MTSSMKNLLIFLSLIAISLAYGCSASQKKSAEILGAAEKIAMNVNLKSIAVAGRTVLLENGETQVTFKELKSAGLVNSVRPIKGETYDNLVVKKPEGHLPLPQGRKRN